MQNSGGGAAPARQVRPSADTRALRDRLRISIATFERLDEEIRMSAGSNATRGRLDAVKAKIDAEYCAAIKVLAELSRDMTERTTAAVLLSGDRQITVDSWGPSGARDALAQVEITKRNRGVHTGSFAVALFVVRRGGHFDIELRSANGRPLPRGFSATEIAEISSAIKRRPSLVRALESAVDGAA